MNNCVRAKVGWTERTLDQVAENLDSMRVPITKSDRTSGPYPYYGASGIVDYVADYIFDGEALLISEDGANLLARSTPIAFSVSGKYWVNNHAHVLRFADSTMRRFIEFFFQSIALDEYIRGAAQPKLTQGALNSIPIPIPSSAAEMRRIVGILDEAFESVATAKANAEKNLQNARAVFENQLQAVFAQGGEGWAQRPLGSLASFRNGVNYTRESKGDTVRIVGVRDFRGNYWIPSQNLETVVIDGELNGPELLRRGDIVVVRSNGNAALIGRCLLAGQLSGKVAHSGFTIRVRLSTPEMLPEYLCHFMRCAASRERLVDSGTGTNIKSLNQQALSALGVPFPTKSQQEALVASLECVSAETQRLESLYRLKLAALDELKQSLLHQAFTGGL